LGVIKEAVVAYNPWYSATYEHILEIAEWARLSADVEKKVVGVFSWMPQTIMSIKAAGGGFRFEQYNATAIAAAVLPFEQDFLRVRELVLTEFDIDANRELVGGVCNALFPIMGSVASSKYLHFSAPKLFPMWDRQIRHARHHQDTVDGFLAYIADFRSELEVEENLKAALQKYPGNPVRGWDIVGMENR
jgi:hypothetical protein